MADANERRLVRAALFASAQEQRMSGRPFTPTPREDVTIVATSVPAPDELFAARPRPVLGQAPDPDGHHQPAVEET